MIGGLQLHWGRVEVAASCSRCKHIHTHTEHSKNRDGRRTHIPIEAHLISDYYSFLIFCRAESSLSLFLARRRHKVQSSSRCNTSSSILTSLFTLQIPQKRRTKKFYLALLRGHVEEDRVDIDIPIGGARIKSTVSFSEVGLRGSKALYE